MDNQTIMLTMTLVLVALYALVMLARSLAVGVAVFTLLAGVAGFFVWSALIAAFALFMIGGFFLMLFGITFESILRGILSGLIASLLTPLVYIVLVTPGVIALRRGIAWRKGVLMRLVPMVLIAGGVPLWNYSYAHSRYREAVGEELSLPLPQRPPRLSISQTTYRSTNIGWRDPLEEVPCAEFCQKLLVSRQTDAVRLNRTVKLALTKGGIDISSVAAVYRLAQGDQCAVAAAKSPRAVTVIATEGSNRTCILGEPGQSLPGAIEISFYPVPDEDYARGQAIEISDITKPLWRRGALKMEVLSFPYMLDSGLYPFTRSVKFGAFDPDERGKREFPIEKLHTLLTQRLGYDLR